MDADRLLLAAAALVARASARSATRSHSKARHFPHAWRTWRRSRWRWPGRASRTPRPRRSALHARGLVLSRAGLPAGSGVDEIIGAATALGLDDAEARAVAGAAEGDLLRRGAGAGEAQRRWSMRDLRDRVGTEIRKVVVGQGRSSITC